MSETSFYCTHTHTHTNIIPPPHFTTIFSLHTFRSLHTTFCLCQRHWPRQTKLCWV